MNQKQPQSLQDAYRLADQTGRPVVFDGKTIHPDYRPGFTTVFVGDRRNGQ